MSLAVYTTIYPGVERFLGDWSLSLRQQTDQNYSLWIGLDSLSRENVEKLLGEDLKANWFIAPIRSTPAGIRQQALSRVVESSKAVVLVDSDDILEPSRLSAARTHLETSDLTGCALSLVDHNGVALGGSLSLPKGLLPEQVLPRNNVFGCSNSAFKSSLLKQCMPIPSEAILVDWYLATRAWLLGAKISFDRTPRMKYRQHVANTARIRPPFSSDQILSDTSLVQTHFQLLKRSAISGFMPERVAELEKVSEDITAFKHQILSDPARLALYAAALNALQPEPIWWSSVANPALKHMWT